jgi:hypothetical protein
MSKEHPVQIWHDGWRNADRILRFMGNCLSCSRATWSFDDGENDPRGILGAAAYWPVGLEHHGVNHEITVCSVCANDGVSYRRTRVLARSELDARQRGHQSRFQSVVVRKVG